MILTVNAGEPLNATLEKIRFGSAVKAGGSLLIKVNLAHPPEPGHPRTNPILLKEVLEYTLEYHGQGSMSRPRIHTHLHKSIANTYQAIMQYSPFGFYINGGKAMFEATGEIDLGRTLVGNDALELDFFILKSFSLSTPEYINYLSRSDYGILNEANAQ